MRVYKEGISIQYDVVNIVQKLQIKACTVFPTIQQTLSLPTMILVYLDKKYAPEVASRSGWVNVLSNKESRKKFTLKLSNDVEVCLSFSLTSNKTKRQKSFDPSLRIIK